MDPIGHKTLRFERFVLDLTRGCVRVGQQEIDLRPKTFQVLTYLAINPGRLVPKQELIEAVWPDVTVTDESLVQCIRELRQKLGDDERRLIKTLPRRGYLLDATLAPCDVQPLQPERVGFLHRLLGLAVALRPPGGVSGRFRAGRGRMWLTAGGLACVLLGAAHLVLPTPALKAGLTQLPPASELFTEDDAKRVAAIAASKELPAAGLPGLQTRPRCAPARAALRRHLGERYGMGELEPPVHVDCHVCRSRRRCGGLCCGWSAAAKELRAKPGLGTALQGADIRTQIVL